MIFMNAKQADKLALGVSGLIGFGWTGLTTGGWLATVASGAALYATLQVLFEVFLAGGESGDAPIPPPGPAVSYTVAEPHQ